MESDTPLRRHQSTATLVADDGEHEVVAALAGDAERLEQQHAALGLEKVLGNEHQSRPAIVFRAPPGLDRAHTRADRRHVIRGEAIVGDQVIAHVTAESEDVRQAAQRLALGLLEGAPCAVSIAGRVRMMRAGERPGVVAIEIVPRAARHLGGGQQIKRAGVQDVLYAELPRCVVDLGGQPAPRGKAAKNLLAGERRAAAGHHVDQRDARLRHPADSRLDGLHDHAKALQGRRDIRRRA